MANNVPSYITEQLEARGYIIVGQDFEGAGHPRIEIQAPNGHRFKWSWGVEGRERPRSAKNNRSQLKHHLNRLEELWRTRKN